MTPLLVSMSSVARGPSRLPMLFSPSWKQMKKVLQKSGFICLCLLKKMYRNQHTRKQPLLYERTFSNFNLDKRFHRLNPSSIFCNKLLNSNGLLISMSKSNGIIITQGPVAKLEIYLLLHAQNYLCQFTPIKR